MIGDPSGKAEERQLMGEDVIEANAAAIKRQLELFLDFDGKNAAIMVNNADWTKEVSYLAWLRDIGKHFSVNYMLSKESVRRRIEDRSQGISYTEFSYSLLQSYDFLQLHRTEGCTVQMGGSDQWGNITTGIDLVRRMEGARAYGVVFPLITQASGVKFGKTEEGAIWLDPEMTSPFRFYQYWINVEDADVVRYLKFFTLLETDTIADLAHKAETEPHMRAAQKALAEDVTRRLHGETGLAKATSATQALFGGDVAGLGAADIADVFADVPSSEVTREALGGEGTSLVDLMAESGIASSKGDARRSIEGGGVYVNNVRVEDAGRALTMDDTIEGRFLLLRKGKKLYHLVAVR